MTIHQNTVRVGSPETARTAPPSSVAPERVTELVPSRIVGVATLGNLSGPPGRSAGAHDLDPRGPQRQGEAS